MKEHDQQKINEAILYVAQKVKNMYNILKVLYFADKSHLSKYGRFVINDVHIIMKRGPVPSFAYDLLKEWRGDGDFREILVDQAFDVKKSIVKPSREPDMDLLSPSDIECLDGAIINYGYMDWRELEKLSHEDPAYIETKQNGEREIKIRTIAKYLDNATEVLEYIEQNCL